jgi:hypothetical protein
MSAWPLVPRAKRMNWPSASAASADSPFVGTTR